ncbi:hypothetical protein [Halobellus rarus]|uniref:Cox cluster protein n=1 Tax=Halobellus rarus TaxID=1126237 RepID=A0ABD6CLN6_9EURY|nr:hypothetical protein [Halobellus rarus]
MAEKDSRVPFWWVVVFLLLALGAGVATVFAVGGELMGMIAPFALLAL